VVLIDGDRIAEVILCKAHESTDDLMVTYQDWNPMDLEHLCISPGIIDFNVRRDWEDLTQMTRVAILGGVTLVVEEREGSIPPPKTQALYCDVGGIALVNKASEVAGASDIFGYKVYLSQPLDSTSAAHNLDSIFDAVSRTGLPLIVDPVMPDQRLYHLASPCHFIPVKDRANFDEVETSQLFASAYAGEAESSDIEDEFDMIRTIRTMSTSQPSNQLYRVSTGDIDTLHKQRERKMTDNFLDSQPVLEASDIYTDLDHRIRANEQDIEYLSHLEQATYTYAGPSQFSIPVPVQPPTETKFNRFRPAPITVEKPFEESDKSLLYFNYLANFPDHWETLGVKKVLKTSANYDVKVHICNLSSASAVNALLQRKASRVTCDTAAHFLGLTDADVQRGDTRLKCCPPIRNRRNCNLMWELLKLNAINMITSQHRAVPPFYKFLKEGSFKQAVSGISSLGYALQQVWTKLRLPCESEAEMEHYLVRLSKWMSLQPAKFLGISDTRGSIAKGKHADLIIWDPYSRTIASGSNGQFPEVFPYTGQVFYGVVHKVIVRGQIACENGKAKSFGVSVGLTA
jgi:allantoinase